MSPFRWGCTFLGFLQTAASDTDRLSANPTIPERRSRHQQQADQPSHRQAQEPTQGKQQEQPKQPDSQQSQQPQSSSQGQSHNGSQPQPAKHKTSRGREAPEDGEDGTRSETQTVSRFVPETGCFMLTTDGALIVSFRGTQPTNLVNFRSSGNISMRQWEGVGRVHNGFYEGGRCSCRRRFAEVLQKTLLPQDSKGVLHCGASAGWPVQAGAGHAEGQTSE